MARSHTPKLVRFGWLALALALVVVCIRSDTKTLTPADSIEAVFTSEDQPQSPLVHKVSFLLDHAEPGSHARFSLFKFYYRAMMDEPVVRSVLAAAGRGVNVQILIDPISRGTHEAFFARLAAELKHVNTQGKSDSWIREYTKTDGVTLNHTKFFLFSNSDGKSDWVVISSENLNDSEKRMRQASIVARDQTLFAHTLAYWQRIRDGGDARYRQAVCGSDLEGHFYPCKNGPDGMLDFLHRLPANAPGRILISMPSWDTAREDLALRLSELAAHGYEIDIITRESGSVVDPKIVEILRRPLAAPDSASGAKAIRVYQVPGTLMHIHAKYLVYRPIPYGVGQTDARAPAPAVWVGSNNFTGIALQYSYETMLKITRPEIVEAFEHNFHEMETRLSELGVIPNE
jgi:phosphatidylserine/phosphatidylglycerophosphate/cardiolipin synthase-like enzyme